MGCFEDADGGEVWGDVALGVSVDTGLDVDLVSTCAEDEGEGKGFGKDGGKFEVLFHRLLRLRGGQKRGEG